nr:VP5 [Big Cypress virus]
MGKFTNFLNRVGSGVTRVANSKATHALLNAVGSATTKFANSEIGQRTITGFIEGGVKSALTGESLGDSIKKSVILNVSGLSNEVPDPLNRVEHELIDSVNCLRQDRRVEELSKKYSKAIHKIYDDEKVLEKYMTKTVDAVDEEENQVAVLGRAVGILSQAVKTEKDQLEGVETALKKEAKVRSENEKTIVEYVRHNYDQLASIAQAEREGLIEEATQTSIEIGAEIGEHMAEIFPVVGGIMSSSAAGARGAVQMYNIGKLIHGLANMHIDHIEIPALSQETVESMVKGDDFQKDDVLLKAVSTKLSVVNEMHDEIEHVEKTVLKNVNKQIFEDSYNQGGTGVGVTHLTKASIHLPRTQRPGIHIYTSSWDSDYVVMFHVVGPYHMRSSFLLCVDFLTDFVGLYDVYVQHHALMKNDVTITGDYSLQSAFDDFFQELIINNSLNGKHLERMQRSATTSPMHVGDITYKVSYTRMRSNAEQLMRDPELQIHLLRGPLAMQRRNFLNALMHGMIVLPTSEARYVL